jgi:hypothetical protein
MRSRTTRFSTRSVRHAFYAVVVGLGLAFAVIASLTPTLAQPAPPPGLITVQGRQLVQNGVPLEVRGMNYYPKDFAWDRFWISYTEAITQIDTELAIARSLGVNSARIFLPYRLFSGTVQTAPYPAYLEDFINRLQARDMVAIVTLFDFYPSASAAPYSATDYLTSTRHISTVINWLGPTNPAVLAWDIKNELDREYDEFGEAQVKAWATEMISFTRDIDPNHLVTVGFYGAISGTSCHDSSVTNTLVYSPGIAAEFASAVDFVSMHYFLSERCFEPDLQILQAMIGDQPIVLEEFGLHTLAAPAIPCATNSGDPRCDDPHTEIEQAAYFNALLSVSEANDVAGYLFWTLNDFSYVLSGTQESHHCQGVLRNSQVDLCQETSPSDYTEKPASETARRHYDFGVAYLDLFDSWVIADTDEPPPGWADNWFEGGALLRGYNPAQLLWSHEPGKVALSKFVTNSTSITGLALSPVLTNVNVDRYPFLAGQVFGYDVRDTANGSDSTLHIGVKEGEQPVRLLTITPGTVLPFTFRLDLRWPPTNWSGSHDFQIALELIPVGENNGYSAAYEFDSIAIVGHRIYLPLLVKERG